MTSAYSSHRPMLIVLGGLPGVGKTSLARALARDLGALHLRIDSIEQAIERAKRAAGTISPIDDSGYRVAYAVAADNLRLGNVVIADSVNPLSLTRAAWRAVANGVPVPALEVEVICSDRDEHRRRVETRVPDIEEQSLPTWEGICSGEYEPWKREHLVIDTAGRTVAETVRAIRARLPEAVTSPSRE